MSSGLENHLHPFILKGVTIIDDYSSPESPKRQSVPTKPISIPNLKKENESSISVSSSNPDQSPIPFHQYLKEYKQTKQPSNYLNIIWGLYGNSTLPKD